MFAHVTGNRCVLRWRHWRRKS